MRLLAEELPATVHQPTGDAVTAFDRIRGKLIGSPQHWALARRLVEQVGPDDTIYCTGEDIGIPVAALCARRWPVPRVVIFAHNLDRTRARAALAIFRCRDRVALWLTNAPHQATFLREVLEIPADRVTLVPEQTDTGFFTPGPPSSGKTRPIVASVGLEKRDYRTLAAATAELDVDVRISGFSRDAGVLAQAFPDVLPPNMERRFYPWPELVELYQNADVIAVSLFPNRFCAGLTTFLEAAACKRPVVITATEGIAACMEAQDIALRVPPGDAAAMRAAIVRLLDDHALAHRLADAAHRHVTRHHNPQGWLKLVSQRLRGFAQDAQASPARPQLAT